MRRFSVTSTVDRTIVGEDITVKDMQAFGTPEYVYLPAARWLSRVHLASVYVVGAGSARPLHFH